MFVFAHAFLGALIGLGFWHLTGDRRALPLCTICAVVPDLLDKPLAFLVPQVFGSGRTLGHSLISIAVVGLLGCLVWHYRHSLLGIACACALFSHQVLDEMWTVPSTWYYPLRGPFLTDLRPDYLAFSFWHEISAVSEWVFAYTLAVIIAVWYIGLPKSGLLSPHGPVFPRAWHMACLLLGVIGMVLILSATGLVASTCVMPTYTPYTCLMAGLLALGGLAFLLSRFVPQHCSRNQPCDKEKSH